MILHVCDRCKKQIKWTKEVRTVVSDPGSLYHFTKKYEFCETCFKEFRDLCEGKAIREVGQND